MKHRGRIPFIARKNGQRMKLYIRPGNDLTPRRVNGAQVNRASAAPDSARAILPDFQSSR
jgi:hypothetical protein